jgi:tetratricopeptide (TPR) repeat protein
MKNLFAKILGPKKTYSYFMEQGEKALQNQQWQEAEKEYARGLEMAEEAKAHREVALCSMALARVNERLDKLAVAETHYRKAYQTHEENEEFEEAGACLLALGRLYCRQRRYPDAEQVLQYAMAIYQRQFGHHYEGIADAATTLADCMMGRNSYAEAEKLLMRAVSIDETARGEGHPNLANELHKLAVCFDKQNKDSDAEYNFKRATSAFEKNRASVTPDTAHRATACYHDYGRFLSRLGKPAEAKAAYTKAMELAEQYPGYMDEGDLAEKLRA